MEISTQKWLDNASNYLNSFTTRCSNGETTDRLCLNPAQFKKLVETVNNFARFHNKAPSLLKNVWDGSTLWQHTYNPEQVIERGATIGVRVRYLYPDDENSQLLYYKETLECKTPIDLRTDQFKEIPFAEESGQSWGKGAWKPTTCEWMAEECKTKRFVEITHVDDLTTQFECHDRTCRDRNRVEDEGKCDLLQDRHLDFNTPTSINRGEGALPLLSGGEIKNPWPLVAGGITTLAFSLLTCQLIRNFCSASQNLSEKVSTTPPDSQSEKIESVKENVLPQKPSLLPVLASIAAVAVSGIFTYLASQNLTRTYSIRWLF